MSDKRCEGCGSINPHIHFKGCAKVQQEHYAKLPTPEPQEAAPQPKSGKWPEWSDEHLRKLAEEEDGVNLNVGSPFDVLT